jgi:hypothetical protein
MEVEVNTQVHKHIHTLGGMGWVLLAAMITVGALEVWSLVRQRNLEDQFEARGRAIEEELRSDTIAKDLAKYNAEETRIQAEINKALMGHLKIGECK